MLNNTTFFQILFPVFFKHLILDCRKFQKLRLPEVRVSILYVKNVCEVLLAVPFLPDSPLVFQLFKTGIIFYKLSEGILAPWHRTLLICNNVVECALLHVPRIIPFPCSFREYRINTQQSFVGVDLLRRG